MIECNKCKAQVNLKVKEERIPGTELDVQYIQCEECKKKLNGLTDTDSPYMLSLIHI